MKKLMWLLICITSVSSVRAQLSNQKLTYLVYGGINGLYITNELPIYETHYGKGWTVGGAVRFGKRVFVQTGIEVANQQITMAARGTENTVVNNAPLTLQTFQVPVLLGIKLIKIKGDFANIRLMLGGKIGIVNPKANVFQLTSQHFEKPLLMPSAGFGLDVWRVAVDLNYQYGGLTPVFKNYAKDAQWHGVTISAGFKI